MKNYYSILEVPVGSSLEEIRQSYRRLSQDHLDNAVLFAQLKEAHEILTSPERRAEYDRENWGGPLDISVTGSAPLSVLPDAEKVSRCPMGAEEQCPVLLGHTAPEDHFCPECGVQLQIPGSVTALNLEAEQSVAPLSIRLEEAGGRIHPLRVGSSIVGREAAEVLMQDKTISRQHARLEVTESGEILLEDLSSTNGTQINDRPLAPHLPRAVANGDQLRFGSVLTTLLLPPSPQAPTVLQNPADLRIPAEPSAQPALGSAAQPRLIEVRADAPEGSPAREFLLTPGITSFGRRPESTVVLQGDPYVSGSHAQLIAENGAVRLVDVGSTNGTLLNGQRLAIDEPAVLSSGDLVVIGGSTLRFESGSAEESTEDFSEKAPDEQDLAQNKPASVVPTEG